MQGNLISKIQYSICSRIIARGDVCLRAARLFTHCPLSFRKIVQMCGLLGSAAPKVDFIIIPWLNPVHLKPRWPPVMCLIPTILQKQRTVNSLAGLLPTSTLHLYPQPHPESGSLMRPGRYSSV